MGGVASRAGRTAASQSRFDPIHQRVQQKLMRFLNAGSDGMGNQQDAIRQVLGFPAPAA